MLPLTAGLGLGRHAAQHSTSQNAMMKASCAAQSLRCVEQQILHFLTVRQWISRALSSQEMKKLRVRRISHVPTVTTTRCDVTASASFPTCRQCHSHRDSTRAPHSTEHETYGLHTPRPSAATGPTSHPHPFSPAHPQSPPSPPV